MRHTIRIILILLLATSASAETRKKVFDPLEPLNKTVPPNILLAVDNSGSMNLDTNNMSIMDFRSRNQVWAGTGDYWHFNVPGQPAWNRVPGADLFDRNRSDIDLPLASTAQSITMVVTGESGTVEYAGLAVDVWIPNTIDRTAANITLVLSHGGVSHEIQPENQWYTYRAMDGDPYAADERCCDGSNSCTDDRKCRRYRITYAFTQFSGMDRNGDWTLSVRSTSPKTVYLDAVHLTFTPLLSKMTVLKTVLNTIIRESDNIRLALGTYKARWTSSCGYSSCYLYDPSGMRITTPSYLWWVTSYNPGFGLCTGWPENELETTSNHTDMLDWLGLDDYAPQAFDSSTDMTHEIMARGYTPIQSCMQDIYSGLTGGDSSLSSLAYAGDPYQACRNYAVIFLTDGRCTESGCDNNTIRDTIQNVYQSHLIGYGTQENTGTRTYVIGLSMSESDRDTLDEWADAGDDGELNATGDAFMPQNSEELLQALATAIYEASSQQVAVNSDVIFGTINPDKAVQYNPLFGTRTVTLTDEEGDVIGTRTVQYPAVEGNILFTTLMYYPVWEGTVKAYQPMYKKIVGGSQVEDESNLFYFANGSYPKLWDAREELVTRLNGTTAEDEEHINGVRDALGLTEFTPSATDDPQWRDIRMVDPTNGSTAIRLNQFIFDSDAGKWRPDPTVASAVAQYYFGGNIADAEQLIVFLQSRQLADITYSTPALVAEPEMGFEEFSEAYFDYKIDKRRNRLPVVTVGANDGMVHAFNAYTGEEEWAVVPAGVRDSLIAMLNAFDPSANPAGQPDIGQLDYLGRYSHHYGVASSPKIVDINLTYGSDVESWATYLICGLGAGGHSYFALDVSDTRNPVPCWDTGLLSDYADMGESWSYPAVWQILVEQHANNPATGIPAGIFTSGPSSDTGEGKALYTINLVDASVMEKHTISDLASDEFLMSAPAGILDTNQRFMKGAYVCDTGGGVFRYQYGNSPCKVYQTNSATPILSTPSIYTDPNKIEWISFGEMGEEDPQQGIFARGSTLYTFKVPTCDVSKTLEDIEDIAADGLNTIVPLEGKDGYYYELDLNEIFYTNPLMSRFYYEDSEGIMQTQTVSIFVTYHYPETGDTCGKGSSSMYMFGINELFIGDPEEDGQVATDVGEGRPGNPVRTGITGTVWINTEDGPVRILPLEEQVDAAVVPLYFPFSGADARRLGAGAWLVK